MSVLFEPTFLINFLVSYFSVVAPVDYITVFNCWGLEDNRHLVGNLSSSAKFSLFVDLSDDTVDWEQQAFEMYWRNRTNLGVVLEYGCPSSEQMLVECAKMHCFTSNTYWVIVDRYSNNSSLIGIENIDLYVNAQVKVLSEKADGHLGLYDVFNNGLSLGGNFNVTFDRAVFVETDQKVSFGDKMNLKNRVQLSDITLKIGLVSQEVPKAKDSVDEITQFFESFQHPATEVAARFGYMLIKALEADLDFRIQFEHFNHSFGQQSGESILEAIEDRHVDLSIFGVINQNTIELTCIQNFMTFRSAFIFRTPAKTSLTDNIFTQPFAQETWLTVVLTILLGAVAVKINFLAEDYLQLADDGCHEHYTFYTLCMESLANFCQEGCEFINRTTPGRLSQMMLFVCSIVVFNYYSSGFFSILMQGPQMSTIKSLIQLADSPLLVAVDGTAETNEFFKGTQFQDVNYMMEKKTIFELSPDHGIERVRDASLAFHTDRMVAYNIIRNTYDFSEVCDLNQIEVMPPQWVGLMMRKDSPFRELFNVRLARLREVGAFKRFSELWITKKPECLVASAVSSVSLEGAFSIFLLLIAGTVAAFLAFTLECGLFRTLGRRRMLRSIS